MQAQSLRRILSSVPKGTLASATPGEQVSNSILNQCKGHRHYWSSPSNVIDLRSDTLTMPSKEMLEAAMTAPVGDDVYGEDPTVIELESTVADMFGKEKALYLPTGTMANLTAVLSHCHTRASEIIVGSSCHINLWEGGNAAGMGGVHAMQVTEDADGRMNVDDVKSSVRRDDDDHTGETKLLCLENTHNERGGVALPPSYMDEMGDLAHDMGLKCHVDGARIFNSIVAHKVTPKEMCKNVDSVSLCLSKGLGAPLGSVLVGETEFIRLAKRARKRIGGGMRQAGVVAAMGLYAVQNNVERLRLDNARAKKIGSVLHNHGLKVARGGKVDTNMLFFSLPEDSKVTNEELPRRAEEEYGVRFGGGYSKSGDMFRLVTHLGIDDEGVDRALEAIVNLTTRG